MRQLEVLLTLFGQKNSPRYQGTRLPSFRLQYYCHHVLDVYDPFNTSGKIPLNTQYQINESVMKVWQVQVYWGHRIDFK